MNEPAAQSPSLVDDLVVANRILAIEGVLDGFGHVSVRSDQRADRFYLARSLAPALVTATDIMEFDLDGTPVDARGRGVYVERFIHGEILRARPDVMAVAHSHSPSVIPFGATNTALQPIYHMGGFLGAGTPIFDIRKVAGETNMLITDGKLAWALAECLGEKAVALMRGHGAVAVGKSLQQVVYRAIYTEMNARLQSTAMLMGPVTYLTEIEASGAAAVNDAALARPWELWKRKVVSGS